MIEKVLLVATFFLLAGAQTQQGICRLDGTGMTCRGKNSLHGLQSGKDYSEVDTLNVHQDKIDLTDDLIPSDINFSRLTLLNATDNEITRIGRRGFDKIRNVEYLYLSRNKIYHVQPDPFQALTKLDLLEMHNSIDGATAKIKETVLKTLFKSKNEFVHLTKIGLNSNGLETINPKTFCGVKGLIRLELSNNKLTSFDFARSCFGELKGLELAGNLIQNIPADIWDFLPSLSSLDISNNPLNCDCETVKLLSDDDVVFINQAQTKCASPPELEGKSIFDVPKGYCNTKRNPTGFASFSQFIILFIISIAILYSYKRYRERLSHMSSSPVGYHNLEYEQAVEPEFV